MQSKNLFIFMYLKMRRKIENNFKYFKLNLCNSYDIKFL